MDKIKLTPEQLLASTRRSSLLVSAAAGSGKTRVLTSRLMEYVKDGADIDEFLVITYTRAAALELRSRIVDELSRLAAADPENRRLRRQLSLCYKAHIGTIHSFCAALIRENSHKLSLAPDVTVGDEEKCRELKLRALEKTLDAFYETLSEKEGFAELLGSVGAGRDDSRLVSAVLDLHEKLQSHPYPEAWAREQIAAMKALGAGDASETPWGRALLDEAERSLSFWVKKLDEVWLELCENPEENAKLISAYGESLSETMSGLFSAYRASLEGWDALRRELPVSFPRLKPLYGYEFEDRKARFTQVRAECQKACKSLCATFDSPSEKLLAELKKTAPAMSALFELALELDRRFALEKRRHKLLDYSDLEHLAVRLLCDEKTLEPTALAREKSPRFREILVDEYQDVAAVQELILRCLSKDGGNLFMVGDVKQSIYRFRLAAPEIFLSKLKTLPPAETAPEGVGARVLLRQNFRSDSRVLAACNAVFKSLMSKTLGDIDYNDDCALYPPEDAPPPRGAACLSIIATPGGDDSEERPDKTAIEAQFVARRIKTMTERGDTITDGGVERPLVYGDFAILLRSPGAVGAIFERALKAAGVPVNSGSVGGFFSSPEIVVMRALLAVIDNPHRDVPLASTLSSPLFGFSSDELARLRACRQDGNLYGALVAFSSENEKSRAALDAINELRALSCDLSLYELVCHIYDSLLVPALFTVPRGGERASGNLVLLSGLAAEFENGRWRSLSRFLARLKSMEERGAQPGGSGADSSGGVKLMSIHKSKGLEFPVVFLCGASRQFNKKDLSLPVLIHAALGLGGKITDLERGIEYPGLAYRAIRARQNGEALSEEMRVMYVALTRAREKLFISCTAAEPDNFIEALSGPVFQPPDAETLRSCKSMAQWLTIAALNDNSGALELETVYPQNEPEAPSETEDAKLAVSREEFNALCRVLDYEYPFAGAAKLPSKLTATALTREEAQDEAASLLSPVGGHFAIPDLSGAKRPLTAAQRGVATHTVMQFIDFDRTGTPGEIEDEISRILKLGQLDERQAASVDRAAILRFFAGETGARIRAADKVTREFRFSLLVEASQFYPGAGDEKLLLQGVVDCFIEEAGEITVIDYKTDHISPETKDALEGRYRPQLEAYALAVKRITGLPVKETLLCFLQERDALQINNATFSHQVQRGEKLVTQETGPCIMGVERQPRQGEVP